MGLLQGKNIFKNVKEVVIINGLVNDNLTAPLVQLNSESVKSNRLLLKRLSYFTIESFQNVIKHGSPVLNSEVKMTKGMYAYVNDDNAIKVFTSNEVPITNVVSFEKRLLELKKLSQEELRSLYLEKLKVCEISESGGAGLGLMDMLRKTKGKVFFNFTPENDGRSNFILETIVEGSEQSKGTADPKAYQSFMDMNDLLLYRQGLLVESGFSSICQLISLELQINKSNDVKNYEFAVLELIRNVDKYASKKYSNEASIFLKSNNDGVFDFYAGSLVDVSKMKGLSERLIQINGYSQKQLNIEFNKKMSLSKLNSLEESELAWLKIRRQLGGQIQFQFEKHSSELSYFYVGIKSK